MNDPPTAEPENARAAHRAGPWPCSPHRRGCFRSPIRVLGRLPTAPLPRGDVPRQTGERRVVCSCSLHPRGCPPALARADPARSLLPASAGVFPPPTSSSANWSAAPCICGDFSGNGFTSMRSAVCSPYPRGCSQGCEVGKLEEDLFPALAGMFPARRRRLLAGLSAPRTRGDVPFRALHPRVIAACSSYSRGCSHQAVRQDDPQPLLSVSAGMPRPTTWRRSTPRAAPRTRGDVPVHAYPWQAALDCSLHLRGCSQPRDRVWRGSGLLFAPAGMFPTCLPIASV